MTRRDVDDNYPKQEPETRQNSKSRFSLCVVMTTASARHAVTGRINGKWLPDYRAMHFSAKRGIAIACRLSVRPSVCDVGEL